MILSLITFSAITALASALHGANTATKWLIAAGHAAVLCVANMTPFPIIGVLFYWLMMRTSKQAKAELAAMDTINYPHHTLSDRRASVLMSYFLPVCIVIFATIGATFLHGQFIMIAYACGLFISLYIPYWSVSVCNYSTKLGRKLGWPYTDENGKIIDKFIQCRRFTEFVTGAAPCGIAIWLITQTLGLIWIDVKQMVELWY